MREKAPVCLSLQEERPWGAGAGTLKFSEGSGSSDSLSHWPLWRLDSIQGRKDEQMPERRRAEAYSAFLCLLHTLGFPRNPPLEDSRRSVE